MTNKVWIADDWDVRERNQDPKSVDDVEVDQPLKPRLSCIRNQAVIEAMKRQSCKCCCSCKHHFCSHGNL